MCDLAHLLLTERIERGVLADRQGLLASGVRRELPTVHAALDDFDAAMAAEPQTVTPLSQEQLELRQVLGVA